jgi:hypothetical protein
MNPAGLCRAEEIEKPVKSGENRSTRHIPEPGILAQHMRGNTFGFQ